MSPEPANVGIFVGQIALLGSNPRHDRERGVFFGGGLVVDGLATAFYTSKSNRGMKIDRNAGTHAHTPLFWPAEFPSKFQKHGYKWGRWELCSLSWFYLVVSLWLKKSPVRTNNCIYGVWTEKYINICEGLLCVCYKGTCVSLWHYSWKQIPSVFLFTLLNVNVESSENTNKIWMMNIPRSLV